MGYTESSTSTGKLKLTPTSDLRKLGISRGTTGGQASPVWRRQSSNSPWGLVLNELSTCINSATDPQSTNSLRGVRGKAKEGLGEGEAMGTVERDHWFQPCGSHLPREH